MKWEKDENLNPDILQHNEQKCKENPFACDLREVWEKIKQKNEELNRKCAPNTYVWIEKFKDDNF